MEEIPFCFVVFYWDVEVVASGKGNTPIEDNKTKWKIMEEIPDCFGKSLLILNRPTRTLIPRNTWPATRPSSFVEVDRLKTVDDGVQADQRIFEDLEETPQEN